MMVLMKVLSIILGVFLVLAGMQMIMLPSQAASSVPVLLGICMIVAGVYGLYSWAGRRRDGQTSGWMLAGDILAVVLGVFLLVSAAVRLAIETILPYLGAAFILAEGIVAIVSAIRSYHLVSSMDAMPWTVQLVLGILMVIVGIVLLLNPVVTFVAISVIFGVEIIIIGARTIALGCFL